jgi:hypothetical protein
LAVLCGQAQVPQTFKCDYQTIWDLKTELKTAQNTITISDKEISISKFLNGGTEPLKLAIDSVVEKEYLFKPSIWYYCHDNTKKQIFIASKSTYNKSFDLYDFSDEVTIFHYGFLQKTFKK